MLTRREIKAVDLLGSCLDRIAQRDFKVHAFVSFSREAAFELARHLDAGAVRGLLHGLPFGVKDLLDTTDFPTAYGSPIYAGHQPAADAAAVALCREAGAVLLGKTVTTELANLYAGATRNPHNLDHTPGGSSSGSAAAVADAMVPFALGTQTAGSVIRPASFCGVVGFKPTHNRVPKAGVKALSETLDSIGVFGRSVRDAALLGAVLTGDIGMADPALFTQPLAPRIGLCQTPEWALADADTRRAWAHAEKVLADVARPVMWPEGMNNLATVHQEIQNFETARSLSHERRVHLNQISAPLQARIADGLAISGETHARHLRTATAARQQIDALFKTHDFILAPSSVGEAPAGLDFTGDPVFCRTWTLLGLPCIHLPFFKGSTGMPVGLQLVGAYGDDRRLLAAAHGLHTRLIH
jgi:Asp-tRNA(Asn)/Glu-tRNA(Gln) amidotransferase A subunit family amidase